MDSHSAPIVVRNTPCGLEIFGGACLVTQFTSTHAVRLDDIDTTRKSWKTVMRLLLLVINERKRQTNWPHKQPCEEIMNIRVMLQIIWNDFCWIDFTFTFSS